MNSKFIVRQPIRDRNNRTIGFEILYYGENQAYGDLTSVDEYAVGNTVYQFLMENTDRLLSGTVCFMTFNTALLVKKTPHLFNKDELVIQVDDSVVIHPFSMYLLQQYHQEGYRIAVNQFLFAPRYLSLLDYIDFIKVNFEKTQEEELTNILEIAHSLGKKCIAVEVDSEDHYRRALSLGADGMEGSYVAERLSVKSHSSTYLQSNFFQLVVAVTKDDPSIPDIVQIISRDAGLTYGLLRLANSGYVAPRHRITSIQQAVTTLGMLKMRQWLYLINASGTEEATTPETEEFLKVSFLRANFCSELLKYTKDVPISKNEAYLMGMFSMMNYLIDAPLEEILSPLFLPKEIEDALLRHTGVCSTLFELVLSYEKANWKKILSCAADLHIETQYLTNIYFDCVEYSNFIWKQMVEDPSVPEEDAKDSDN